MPAGETQNMATEVSDLRALMDERIREFFGVTGAQFDGANLSKVERLAAGVDSSLYLNREMSGCDRYGNSHDLLTAALGAANLTGQILEFGVYSGRTINHIASLTDANVHGFDSFEGLPESWRPDHVAGSFKRADLPEVSQNVILHVGLFNKTLPTFANENREAVAFLHVDCDLYSSTKTIFRYLSEQIVSGTVIVFDEYFNYVGWRNHEYKAFQEFIAYAGLRYRYIGAVPSHQQVAVLIL